MSDVNNEQPKDKKDNNGSQPDAVNNDNNFQDHNLENPDEAPLTWDEMEIDDSMHEELEYIHDDNGDVIEVYPDYEDPNDLPEILDEAEVIEDADAPVTQATDEAVSEDVSDAEDTIYKRFMPSLDELSNPDLQFPQQENPDVVNKQTAMAVGIIRSHVDNSRYRSDGEEYMVPLRSLESEMFQARIPPTNPVLAHVLHMIQHAECSKPERYISVVLDELYKEKGVNVQLRDYDPANPEGKLESAPTESEMREPEAVSTNEKKPSPDGKNSALMDAARQRQQAHQGRPSEVKSIFNVSGALSSLTGKSLPNVGSLASRLSMGKVGGQSAKRLAENVDDMANEVSFI